MSITRRSSRFPRRLWVWLTDLGPLLALSGEVCPDSPWDGDDRKPTVHAVLPITIDPFGTRAQVGRSAVSGPLTHEHPLLAYANDITEALRGCTTLARVFSFDPARHGLVHREIPQRWPGLLLNDLSTAFLGEMSVSGLAAEHAYANHGWFAPRADLNAFGTPYLRPTSNIRWGGDSQDREDEDLLGNARLEWGLFQVGLEQPMARASWQDRPGLQALVAQVLDCDAEAATVMRSLTPKFDADELRQARREFNGARTRLAAQQNWDPSFALRPRLVETAIRDALGRYGLPVLTTRTPRRRRRRSAHIEHITLCYCHPETGEGSEFTDVHAGRLVVLPREISSRLSEQIAVSVAAALAPRALASVFLGRAREQDVIIVTKDAEFFLRHKEAFHLPSDLPVHAVTSAGVQR